MVKSIKTDAGQTAVLFPGSLGDFICVLPTLALLKERIQPHSLVVAVRGQAVELAARISWIAQVHSLDRSVFATLFAHDTDVHDEARQLFASIQHVVSWFGHSSKEVQTALTQLVPGAVCSFAFFHGQAQLHACQYYLQCVGGTGIQVPSLKLGDDERRWREIYWRAQRWCSSSRVLVIHPGSGGKRKRWARDGFIDIARWWTAQRQGKVIILLGPAEEEEMTLWREVGIVENSLALWQVAALLSRADVYVGNDSGVSHLAGAVGGRGAVLFGPTCPAQWRPLGGQLTVMRNRDFRDRTPDVSGISLQELPSAPVIAELARLTARR